MDNQAFVTQIEMGYQGKSVTPGDTVREYKDDEYVGELMVIQVLKVETYAGKTMVTALVYRRGRQ